MTDKIEKALQLEKVNGAKVLLTEEYQRQDKAEWLATKQAEYDTLFKTVLVEEPEQLNDDGEIIVEAKSYYEYVEDCVSFDDWLNETKVVSSVEYNTEDDYDEDAWGINWSDLDETVRLDFLEQVKSPEVTELVRPYTAPDVTERVNTYLAPTLRKLWKEDRQKQVENIVVTTDVGDWDGDETSQTRMARAISVMTSTDKTTWILADNSVVSVTKAQIKEALKLAGEAQTALWMQQ